MNKLTKLALPAGLMALSLASCHHSAELDTITEQNLDNCFVVVKDRQNTVTQTIVSPVNIKYRLNWTNPLCDATITGLNLYGEVLPSINLESMKWSLDDNGCGKVSSDFPAQNVGTLVNAPSVTHFKMEWLFRLDLLDNPDITVYDPVGWFEFDIDERYHLVGARQPTYLGGTTVASCAALPDFSYDDAIYNINLNFNTMKATVAITGAKFNERMPALDMQFNDIAFTLGEEQGSFNLKCDELIPTMGVTPQPDYKITNFEATVFPGHDTSLKFECTPKTMPMTFTVKANVNGADYKAAI